MSKQYLEDCKKLEDGRYRIVEKITLSKNNGVKTILKEGISRDSVVSGKSLPAHGIWTFKIWNDEFNANKRSYAKVIPLAVKSNYTCSGFCNHPEDNQEDVRNYFAVEKNPRIEEGWLVADFYLVGEYGKLANDILECGGPIEISSSCLGDVDYAGYVVTEGFEIERFGDWVWNASNKLFQFQDDSKMKTIDNTLESILPKKEDSDVIQEKLEEKTNLDDLTIYNIDNKLSETGEKTMSDKLSEKALELNIKSMIRDADKVINLFEKKEMLESALSYAKELTDSVLVETINKSILDAEKSIAILAEKGLNVEELNTNIKSLTESKETLDKEIEVLSAEKSKIEENYNSLIKLYEDKQFEASQTELLTNKQLLTLIESLKSELAKATKNSKILTEKRNYFEALANTKIEADEIVKLNEQYKKVLIENEELSDKVNQLRETIRSARKNTMVEKTIEKQPVKMERPIARRLSEFKDKEVQKYYEMLCEEDASVKSLKESFLACSSLKEAQKLRMNLDNKEFSYNEDTLVEKTLKEKGYI